MSKLNSRQLETLMELAKRPRLCLRPLDIGGRNGSHHSNTLIRLCDLGLVNRLQRNSHCSRPSYRYRITEAGLELIDRERMTK
jgi:predicted transcriptional regulator